MATIRTGPDRANNGAGHRHHDSRSQWTKKTEGHDHDVDVPGHPADAFTAEEVTKLKALLAEVQPSPLPPEPEPPPPDPEPEPIPPGPEPPAPPPPAARPFPAPTISREVTLPPSIDTTGTNDVTSALIAFLTQCQPNTRVIFPSTGKLKVPQGITLTGRQQLELIGDDCQILLSDYTGGNRGVFKLDKGNSDIAIRGFVGRGSNPDTTVVYRPGLEYQMGILIYDGKRIEIDGFRGRNLYGDGIYVAGTSAGVPSEDIWAHDYDFDYVGRMGIVPIAVRRGIFERGNLDHVGLIVFDIEQNSTYEIVDGLELRDNWIGHYSLSAHQTNWFLACAPDKGHVANVAVKRNHVEFGAAVNANNPSGKGGLATRFDREPPAGAGSRTRNVQFVDNTTPIAGKGTLGYPAPIYFAHVDGLVVSGNQQPVLSGQAVAAVDCPGAVLA